MDRNRPAQRGHAILIEAFDRRPILLSQRQGAQFERRAVICKALVGLVELRRRNPPPNIVTHDPGYRPPGDRGVSLIRLPTRPQPIRRSRPRPDPLPNTRM